MLCTFCGTDTSGTHIKSGNLMIIAHRECVIDRAEQLGVKTAKECLEYEELINKLSRIQRAY